jgi:hypothetical protein
MDKPLTLRFQNERFENVSKLSKNRKKNIDCSPLFKMAEKKVELGAGSNVSDFNVVAF